MGDKIVCTGYILRFVSTEPIPNRTRPRQLLCTGRRELKTERERERAELLTLMSAKVWCEQTLIIREQSGVNRPDNGPVVDLVEL